MPRAFQSLRRWVVQLLGAMLVSVPISSAWALEPDVRLPGAEARLGVGGGFWVGAWSELRLEARASGVYRAILSAEDGSIRSGLVPFEAVLEVPDAPGERVSTMKIPLFSRRSVSLVLEGPTGSKRVRLEPFQGTPAVRVAERFGAGSVFLNERLIDLSPSEIPADPALWLSGPDVLSSGNLPSRLGLALSAAGARLLGTGRQGALGRVPDGLFGMGVLTAGTQTERGGRLSLEPILLSSVPNPQLPQANHFPLALWSAGLFVVCLAYYSARRDRAVTAVQASVGAMLVGGMGLWALSPRTQALEDRVVVQIGAGGWGLRTEIVSHVSLQDREMVWPPGVKPVNAMARRYTPNGTFVSQSAWTQLAYWTPPRATSVPLRLMAGRLENRAALRFDKVFVVGFGEQEPLGPGASRRLQPGSDWAPPEFARLAERLPRGTVIGFAGQPNTGQNNEASQPGQTDREPAIPIRLATTRTVTIALPEEVMP